MPEANAADNSASPENNTQAPATEKEKKEFEKAFKQKPSLGRIVLYQANRTTAKGHKVESFASLVTKVADDGSVSLVVFAPNSTDHMHGVEYSEAAAPGKWTWPARV